MCRCERCNLHFGRACQEAHPRCATIAKVNCCRNHDPYAADVRAFRTPSHLPSDPSTPRATALARSSDIACSRFHGRQPTAAISCSYRSPHRLPARPPTTTFQDVLLTDVTPEHLPAAAEATPVALRRYQYVCALYGPHHVLRRFPWSSRGQVTARCPQSVLHLYRRIPNWQMATGWCRFCSCAGLSRESCATSLALIGQFWS